MGVALDVEVDAFAFADQAVEIHGLDPRCAQRQGRAASHLRPRLDAHGGFSGTNAALRGIGTTGSGLARSGAQWRRVRRRPAGRPARRPGVSMRSARNIQPSGPAWPAGSSPAGLRSGTGHYRARIQPRRAPQLVVVLEQAHLRTVPAGLLPELLVRGQLGADQHFGGRHWMTSTMGVPTRIAAKNRQTRTAMILPPVPVGSLSGPLAGDDHQALAEAHLRSHGIRTGSRRGTGRG